METLILLGLATTVLFTALSSLFSSRVQQPQIIYVQAAPAEPSGTGCLPLIILVGVVLTVIILL